MTKSNLIYYAHNETYDKHTTPPGFLFGDDAYYAYVVAVNPMGKPIHISEEKRNTNSSDNLDPKGIPLGVPFKFNGSPTELPGNRIAITANDGFLYIYKADLTELA